jgi:hypothetical protein
MHVLWLQALTNMGTIPISKSNLSQNDVNMLKYEVSSQSQLAGNTSRATHTTMSTASWFTFI